jgi:hypothetical protein
MDLGYVAKHAKISNIEHRAALETTGAPGAVVLILRGLGSLRNQLDLQGCGWLFSAISLFETGVTYNTYTTVFLLAEYPLSAEYALNIRGGPNLIIQLLFHSPTA